MADTNLDMLVMCWEGMMEVTATPGEINMVQMAQSMIESKMVNHLHLVTGLRPLFGLL